MDTPQRPLAIINGILHLPAQEIASGVVLVHGEKIVAAGDSATTPVPANALLLDAQQGRISAGNLQRGHAPIVVGQRADLVCHARSGSILWALCAGKICHPPQAAQPPQPHPWQRHRQTALDATFLHLHQHPQTEKIRLTAHLPSYQQRGIDIVWQFMGNEATLQTLTLRVIPTLLPESGSVFVLGHRSAQHLPAASLSHTKAHWWFYHHGPDAALYALPVPALRQWLKMHAHQIPLRAVQIPGLQRQFWGRSLPMQHLQQAIPRARTLKLYKKTPPGNPDGA